MDSQSPPKGSLEELFRHHLLESEAAAVPPRPLVWEHIDNSLLLAENEKYRRRLLGHRWGMAASLLLAALAGAGWWHSQLPAAPNLASVTSSTSAAQREGTATSTARQPRAATGATRTVALATAPMPVQSAPTSAWLAGNAGARATASAASQTLAAAASGGRARALYAPTDRAATLGYPAAPTLATYTYRATTTPRRGSGRAGALASATPFSNSTIQPIGSTATSSLAELTRTTLGRPESYSPESYSTDVAMANDERPAAGAVASRLGEALLDGRQAQLALGPADGLPASLTPLETKLPPATKLRRWQFGAEYAVTAFNPNVDFATGSSSYPSSQQTSLAVSNFSRISQSAAAEYRANLRAGLGQRLSLRATRWLGGHWSLSTGLEATQQEATSATSVGFDGVRMDVASSYNPTPRQLQTSSYRYRSAGVPVELRYDNPVKTGVSFYGRLGAIVSALLNVRTEIASNSETAHSYSPFSGSTPYRRLTALLRGGAGVRYRPANKSWGVSVGPTAETGVQSLNSDTDKSFLQQNRPYSIGLEAGFEFGGGAVPVVPVQ